MFIESDKKELWEVLVERTIANKDLIPLTHYRAFKTAEYFIKGKFPEIELRGYVDKFYHPEKYFDMAKHQDDLMGSDKHVDFKTFLTARAYLYPLCFLTVDNLF